MRVELALRVDFLEVGVFVGTSVVLLRVFFLECDASAGVFVSSFDEGSSYSGSGSFFLDEVEVLDGGFDWDRLEMRPAGLERCAWEVAFIKNGHGVPDFFSRLWCSSLRRVDQVLVT